MDEVELPLLEVSRPALALVEEIGYGKHSLTFRDFQEAAGRPRTTVTRYLNHLTRSWLILRIRQGEYAIPARSTFARLLVEPSPYIRSIRSYADVLRAREEGPWAFACLPIRRAYPMEIDRAIPVLQPDERLEDASRAPPYPAAAWYGFDADDVDPFPLQLEEGEDAQLQVPVLRPELGLAILMSSLDPRFMQAAEEAAERLDLSFAGVAQRAKHLSPERPPVRAIRPNTLVFPDWLQDFWETAKTQHARHALDTFVDGPGSGTEGAAVSTDA